MLQRAIEKHPRLTFWLIGAALTLAMWEGRVERFFKAIFRAVEIWLILGITLTSGFLFSAFMMNLGGSYNGVLRGVAGFIWLVSALACFGRYGYLNSGVVHKEYYNIPSAKILALQKNEDGSTWNIWLTVNTFRDEVMQMLYQLPAEIVDYHPTAWETRLHRYYQPIKGLVYRLDVHSPELHTDFQLRRSIGGDDLDDGESLEDEMGLSG